MKTLLIIRHAKSSWSSGSGSDYERPLNDRGRFDAPRMGEFLLERGPFPDGILSSPAKRAITTALLIARGLGFPETSIQTEKNLYPADADRFQSILRGMEDAWSCACVVGHNPTITDYSGALTGETITNVPTCAVCAVELPITSWAQLRPGIGKRLYFQVPKAL